VAGGARAGKPYQTGGSGNVVRPSVDAVRDAASPKVP